jgi:isopropylmalate/homocitrate/citramalate synthase
MSVERAVDFLYTWNSEPAPSIADVRLENDMRDALQSAYVARPSISQRMALLELDARIGVQYVFVGFPGTSERERDECTCLLDYIIDAGLPVTPVLMSRAVPGDLDVIQSAAKHAKERVLVDIFICLSPLRQKIEGWSVDHLIGEMHDVACSAEEAGLRYRLAYEDSTRTPPEVLRRALAAATRLHPEQIVLNDTVGDSTPSGVTNHVKFAAAVLAGAGCKVDLAWHGHNDKGFALANAMAAIGAGASIISGTFLGIGERSGNIPLEQLIYLLLEGGSTRYDASLLLAVCELVASSTGSEIPRDQPVVGRQCFSTATGTHAAAVLKAQKLGVDFADYAFSAVSAQRVGRAQEILVGPNSGRAAVRAFLEDQLLPTSDDIVAAALTYCHSRNAVACPSELRQFVLSLG